MESPQPIVMGAYKGTITLEKYLAVLYQVKQSPALWSSNSTSRHLSQEIKTYVHYNSCMIVFITALFLLVDHWKQPHFHL